MILGGEGKRQRQKYGKGCACEWAAGRHVHWQWVRYPETCFGLVDVAASTSEQTDNHSLALAATKGRLGFGGMECGLIECPELAPGMFTENWFLAFEREDLRFRFGLGATRHLVGDPGFVTSVESGMPGRQRLRG